MKDKKSESVEITIEFTEQQMELIHRLAKETGKSPAEVVAAGLEAFVSGQGSQYMA
jgi:hypothetical protein